MTLLAQSIYKTLAFFDAQDRPVTLLEVKSYLPEDKKLMDIANALDSELSMRVGQRGGFYFLAGREKLVETRKRKYRISLQNFRTAKKYLTVLRFFPYLRAVAISGSLAQLACTEHSDIDLFVITKRNRIWLSRLLVSLYFQILGVRRHGEEIKGRFCLNHYLCENLEITEDRNFYTAVEYRGLIPILGYKEIEKFWRQNQWIETFIPPSPFEGREAEGREGFRGGVNPNLISRIFELFFDLTSLGSLVNYLSGLYQKHRIRRQEHILVSDAELSFHPGSRGQKVLARFSQQIRA